MTNNSQFQEQAARLNFADSSLIFKGKSVLDYGCGKGDSSFYIFEKLHPDNLVGLDIDTSNIISCLRKKTSDRMQFYEKDCLTFNQTDLKFDIIVCTEVLEHVTDQMQFLRALKSYLKPDGFVFLSTPNKAVFSLTKDTSFLRKDHVKELFFDEFNRLLDAHFSQKQVFSQTFKEPLHTAYINAICASNLVFAIKNEAFKSRILKFILASITKYLVLMPLLKIKNESYPRITRMRPTDFVFFPGHHNKAVWFMAICRV